MVYIGMSCLFFFFKQNTAYEMRISDWSSDVCSSDLDRNLGRLDDADDPRLVVAVGKLTGQRGKQEERQDEQPARNGVERRFLRRIAIDVEGDEQHQRRLE